MKLSRPIASALLFVSTLALASNGHASRSIDSTQTSGEPLQIEIVQVPSGFGTPFRERAMKAIYRNTGAEPLALDEILMDVAYSCRLFDSRGNEVRRLPIGYPIEPTKDHMVVLEPGEKVEAEFTVDDLTEMPLDSPPYEIRCCYANLEKAYPEHLGFTKLKVCTSYWLYT